MNCEMLSYHHHALIANVVRIAIIYICSFKFVVCKKFGIYKDFFCRNVNVNVRWRNVWLANVKKVNGVLQKSVPA